MSYAIAEKRRVFLACRPIFTGDNAQVRKRKNVQKIVVKHRQSLSTLLADFGENKVIEILRVLLERRIFQSEIQARAQFPELFSSSPAQDVRRAESENDAARSVAELIDEIESVEGQGEEVVAEVVTQAVPQLRPHNAAPVEAEEVHDTPEEGPISSLKIPTLYPLYFSYSAQHAILNAAQRILEECCFEFAKKWLPQVLDTQGWDCAAAVELTKWSQILKQHSDKIPTDAITLANGSTLSQLLLATHRLRHAAVHRLPTTAREVNRFVQSAIKLTEALQDSKHAAQLDDLHQEIGSKINAMELSKNALEETLRLELESIASRRKELDEEEANCINKMLVDDRENKALIANLLGEFVRKVLEGRGAEQECSESCSDEEGTEVFEDSR